MLANTTQLDIPIHLADHFRLEILGGNTLARAAPKGPPPQKITCLGFKTRRIDVGDGNALGKLLISFTTPTPRNAMIIRLLVHGGASVEWIADAAQAHPRFAVADLPPQPTARTRMASD